VQELGNSFRGGFLLGKTVSRNIAKCGVGEKEDPTLDGRSWILGIRREQGLRGSFVLRERCFLRGVYAKKKEKGTGKNSFSRTEDIRASETRSNPKRSM